MKSMASRLNTIKKEMKEIVSFDRMATSNNNKTLADQQSNAGCTFCYNGKLHDVLQDFCFPNYVNLCVSTGNVPNRRMFNSFQGQAAERLGVAARLVTDQQLVEANNRLIAEGYLPPQAAEQEGAGGQDDDDEDHDQGNE